MRCRGMGFHPLKARLTGQFLLLDLSTPKGALHQGVKIARRFHIPTTSYVGKVVQLTATGISFRKHALAA